MGARGVRLFPHAPMPPCPLPGSGGCGETMMLEDRAQELWELITRYVDADRPTDLRPILATERPEDIAEALRHMEKETGRRIFSLLEEESAGAVLEYLDEVENALVRSIDPARNQQPEKDDENPSPPFQQYEVNLLIENEKGTGPPVVIETNPTYVNLFGSIEQTYQQQGILRLDLPA